MSELLIRRGGVNTQGYINLDNDSFKEAVARRARVQLNGLALTPVVFGASTKAYQVSTKAGPYASAHGETLIATPDALGAATITIAAVAGKHVSGASPSTDISASVDHHFRIAVNADAFASPVNYQNVTIDPTGLATGSDIAAELEAKIQALGGDYAAVTVVYGAGVYTITSGQLGTGSKVLVAAGLVDDISTELKIGALGVNTAGTGNVADVLNVTVAELVAVGMAGFALSEEPTGELKIESLTAGRLSKVTMGSGTLNTAIGFTGSAVAIGSQGMGYSSDMATDAYFVAATMRAAASLVDKALSVNTPTVAGFDLVCEDSSSEDYVDLIVFP